MEDTVFVATRDEVPIDVRQIEDERVPEGMVCMATFLDGRLIARSAVDENGLRDLLEQGLLEDPVRLGLAAIEREPGIQARLFALLPPTPEADSGAEPEPWARSVPRFEDRSDDDTESITMLPLLLGNIVRFRRDRRHPDDLAREAADLLAAVVAGEKMPGEVVDRVLEDLLGD